VTSTPSFVEVNGNLTLGGSVVVAVDRDSIYANNISTPLFKVTGTVTLNPVAASTTISSPFVSFVLSSSASGGVTTVSAVTQRKSYATVADNNNAAAAAQALDSAVGNVVTAITNDANGGAQFPDVASLRNTQDLANLIANLDFLVPSGTAADVFNDLSGGATYGSLRAFDRTRVLRDGFDDVLAGAGASTMTGLTVWGNPIFRSTRLDGNSGIGTSDVDSDEGGVTAGIDARFSDAFGVGIGGGYTKSRIKDKSPSYVRADVDTYMIGINAYYVMGPFSLGGQVDYARATYSANRALPAMGRAAQADFGGNEWRGELEGSYSFDTDGNGMLTPYLAVDVRRSEINAFNETGAGGVSLDVQGRGDTVTNPRLGLRWAGMAWSSTAFTLTPQIEAAYTFSNDMDTSTTMTFAGAPSSFTTQGVSGRGFATIQAGLYGSIGGNGTIGLVGAYDFAGKTTATSIAAKLAFHM
jgi:hypothetical protein